MVDDEDDNDLQAAAVVVCCMCGDVGFSEKLFRCHKCRHRFQHSYCSNYYNQFSEAVEQCDWCRSEERRAAPWRKSLDGGSRSHYSGLKIKQQQQEEESTSRDDGTRPSPAARNHGGLPSPKPSTRRYKLLKDVMC
ncbi:unnamed protein product [Linum trigynum]|uniref:PHD-type zinc finger plants domain-containing protein n=1 Tax=Linum trigynum TaxID=586398 RepID=A0AAV2CZF0_9ROSI